MQNQWRKIIGVAAMLALSLALVQCEAEDGTMALDDEASQLLTVDPAIPVIPTSHYFIVTHPDYRDCAWPMCGGYFVARVNTDVARCADGMWKPECHALEFDLSALGLSDDEEAKVLELIENQQALVRGNMVRQNVAPPPSPSIVLGDVLVATEVWIGVTGTAPTGHFSRLDDTGIDCVTYPCPYFEERSLNTNLFDNLAGLDFTPSGANDKQIEEAKAELNASGLLTVGIHGQMTGPAGTMNTLLIYEFYSRVVPSTSITAAP